MEELEEVYMMEEYNIVIGRMMVVVMGMGIVRAESDFGL
jgi:hypothetical protein